MTDVYTVWHCNKLQLVDELVIFEETDGTLRFCCTECSDFVFVLEPETLHPA